ncbi:hypothetical protein AWC00_03040 [Mycobacterium conspicuum]|nr:hypothetical protein AWC00_03040 [Mycobacterium conspicuum]
MRPGLDKRDGDDIEHLWVGAIFVLSLVFRHLMIGTRADGTYPLRTVMGNDYSRDASARHLAGVRQAHDGFGLCHASTHPRILDWIDQ